MSKNCTIGHFVLIGRTVVNAFVRIALRPGIRNQRRFRFVFTMNRPLLPIRSRQDQQKLKDFQLATERNSRMQVEA